MEGPATAMEGVPVDSAAAALQQQQYQQQQEMLYLQQQQRAQREAMMAQQQQQQQQHLRQYTPHGVVAAQVAVATPVTDDALIRFYQQHVLRQQQMQQQQQQLQQQAAAAAAGQGGMSPAQWQAFMQQQLMGHRSMHSYPTPHASARTPSVYATQPDHISYANTGGADPSLLLVDGSMPPPPAHPMAAAMEPAATGAPAGASKGPKKPRKNAVMVDENGKKIPTKKRKQMEQAAAGAAAAPNAPGAAETAPMPADSTAVASAPSVAAAPSPAAPSPIAGMSQQAYAMEVARMNAMYYNVAIPAKMPPKPKPAHTHQPTPHVAHPAPLTGAPPASAHATQQQASAAGPSPKKKPKVKHTLPSASAGAAVPSALPDPEDLLPQSDMKLLIRRALPANFAFEKEAARGIVLSAVEFINLVTSEANHLRKEEAKLKSQLSIRSTLESISTTHPTPILHALAKELADPLLPDNSSQHPVGQALHSASDGSILAGRHVLAALANLGFREYAAVLAAQWEAVLLQSAEHTEEADQQAEEHLRVTRRAHGLDAQEEAVPIPSATSAHATSAADCFDVSATLVSVIANDKARTEKEHLAVVQEARRKWTQLARHPLYPRCELTSPGYVPKPCKLGAKCLDKLLHASQPSYPPTDSAHLGHIVPSKYALEKERRARDKKEKAERDAQQTTNTTSTTTTGGKQGESHKKRATKPPTKSKATPATEKADKAAGAGAVGASAGEKASRKRPAPPADLLESKHNAKNKQRRAQQALQREQEEAAAAQAAGGAPTAAGSAPMDGQPASSSSVDPMQIDADTGIVQEPDAEDTGIREEADEPEEAPPTAAM